MADETEKTPEQRVNDWMIANKVTIESTFIPWSKSRNAPNPKATDERGRKGWRSLNWEVRVMRDGRLVTAIDYSAGEAHCPAYKAFGHGRKLVWQFDTITRELETGLEHGTTYETCHRPKGAGFNWEAHHGEKRKKFAPKAADVLYSLASDSDVLDYATFEEWADCFGYDVDSRSAESTYRKCLKLALKMRAGLGKAGLQSLRDACQDY